MKVFDLLCANEHRFEGWFASADDFERQREGGMIACPLCGDSKVVKVPSAAYVNTGATDRSPAPPQAVSSPTPQEQYANLRSAVLARVVEYVVKNTEDVGAAFPEEARRIHYGEAPERKIRGTASKDDVDRLRDEGIDVVPLPVVIPADKPH